MQINIIFSLNFQPRLAWTRLYKSQIKHK